MHIWTLDSWEKYYNEKNCRHGIYLKMDAHVDPNVRRATKEFVSWLRKEYYFPQKIVIYIKATPFIKAKDGDSVSATFFEPTQRNCEPFAKIATGDYQELLSKLGQDDALAAILHSIAHELTHYFQWINDIVLTDRGRERQAKSYADLIVYEYALTREHP